MLRRVDAGNGHVTFDAETTHHRVKVLLQAFEPHDHRHACCVAAI
jgi:hypothetical protein